MIDPIKPNLSGCCGGRRKMVGPLGERSMGETEISSSKSCGLGCVEPAGGAVKPSAFPFAKARSIGARKTSIFSTFTVMPMPSMFGLMALHPWKCINFIMNLRAL